MIETISASKLQIGDVFSTDGYVVTSAATLYDGRVSVECHSDDSGGITKRALLEPDFQCHLWRADPTYVVIESTPGYLPDDDDPPTFTDYAAAVEYLNERAAEYADDPDGNYRVSYGIASCDNLAAVVVHDDDKMHDLGRYIGIELDHSDVN